ncbi:MAG: UDP-N-acetylmuramoyl-L-alanine--D-glutamate ligase [Anaerolineales bacterium]|nr:UDP-N-acetylmuramoyl-L-alanine--D-glutamate ligase [Anaerolineales bacterium]
MTEWSGKRVLILGAARQGLALARWLARRAARVTLSDSRPLEALASARAALAEVNVQWAVGGHPLELLNATDLLCISGGVPLTLPIVQEALKRGIPLSNDSQIFMEAVPCKTIGITGSAGKTTTTTLVGEMAKRAMPKTASVFVGGNIGDPLIKYVDEMQKEDLAILELSSFQLEQMTIAPNVAAVLNITPNHLDRHGTMEAYTQAKARILEFQHPSDVAILSRDDAGAWNLRDQVKGQLLAFSLQELDEHLNGAYIQNGWLNVRAGAHSQRVLPREKIQLRGAHNVSNVLAALLIGHAAGFNVEAMCAAVENFRGVPHRLEFIREWQGVQWYNDSIATAPERSMAAILAFDEPIVLLLGGRDKNLPWDEIAKLIHRRVSRVVVFGEAGEMIQKAVAGLGGASRVEVHRVENVQAAVHQAAKVARAGDVVLFSPGGTSFDEFIDFAERGAAFQKWVQELS